MMNDNYMIGKLIQDIVNHIDSNKQKSVTKKVDMHYIQQLAREPSRFMKLVWELKEKITAHSCIKRSVSDMTLRHEIASWVMQEKNLKKARDLLPETIGAEIIENIVTQRQAKYVSFILEGLYVPAELRSLGGVEMAILRDLFNRHNIRPVVHNEIEYKTEGQRVIYEQNCLYEKNNLNTLCIGVQVNAVDNSAAINLASFKLNNVLNLLRLLIPLDYGVGLRPRIAYYDIEKFDEAYIIDFPTYDRSVFSQSKSVLLPYIPSLTRYGVKKSLETASKIFTKTDGERTVDEANIVRAINWAGEGIDALEKDVKVMKCVIALEVLFRLKRSSKARQFANEIESIFRNYGADDIDIKKRAKKVYELRSNIVHKGYYDIPDELAEWAERLASGCILAVLDNHE